MRFDKHGVIEFIHFPHAEAKEIITAMEQAEKTADLDGLRRCARQLVWIYNIMLEMDGTCVSGKSTLFCSGPSLDVPVYTPARFNRGLAKVKEAGAAGVF